MGGRRRFLFGEEAVGKRCVARGMAVRGGWYVVRSAKNAILQLADSVLHAVVDLYISVSGGERVA